jgi:hypothetical protein
MSSDGKEEEMICALTADEHNALNTRLRELPDTMPPRAVWHRIREQAEAEGLLQQTVMQRRSTWYAGFGVAAAALVAAVMLPGILQTPIETNANVSPVVMTESPLDLSALQTLMVQSSQLESDLRSLPDEPRVMRASTMATISDIEDRIAAIDYQLNDPEVNMTPGDRELFWRERVRLMKSLLQLRYAQAQRAAF